MHLEATCHILNVSVKTEKKVARKSKDGIACSSYYMGSSNIGLTNLLLSVICD